MVLTKTIRPMNSLIFISDSDGGEPPQPVRGAHLLSTSSCISVVCFPEPDGPTEVVLGRTQDVGLGSSPVFDGSLSTPNRVVLISAADYEKILEANVQEVNTHNPIWPDKIIVGWDDER